MAEGKQLLPGFNHNVKHGGKLYHVQTEDSGSPTAVVTTHLFLGGNVIASRRTSYADYEGAADLATHVRKLMEDQHKEMMRALIRGAFTAVEAERTAQGRVYAPGELAQGGAGDPPPKPGIEPPPPPQAPPPPEAPPARAPPPGFEPPAPARVPSPSDAPPPAEAPPRIDAASARVGAPPPAPPRPSTAPTGAPVTAFKPRDPWGPPVLPRLARSPMPPPPPEPEKDSTGRRLDELVLSYLADVGTKRER
jgi:hypothetical protein